MQTLEQALIHRDYDVWEAAIQSLTEIGLAIGVIAEIIAFIGSHGLAGYLR